MMWLAASRSRTSSSEHPTLKILALSFLILIGFSLVAEGVHFEIPKGYIYFAMAFSVGVEMINIRVRKNKPVKLHGPDLDDVGARRGLSLSRSPGAARVQPAVRSRRRHRTTARRSRRRSR